MDKDEIKKQTREIINELVEYPFSQAIDILPAEQKLKALNQQLPNAIEPLIGLLFVDVMLGKRQEALTLVNTLWSIGGDLSSFFELIFEDCLLNLGEVDKAGILMQSRLANIRENLGHFYQVMVKYALISGDLALLKKIGDYPEAYEQEMELFEFAANHAFDLSIKDYRAIWKIVLDNLKDCLCAWEYKLHPGDEIELLLYTSAEREQNEQLQNQMFDKIDGYFASMQVEPLDDLYLKLLNIKLHPAWIKEQVSEE